MSIIKTQDLCKDYGSNHILSNINLQIEQGEFVVVMGQSGCGKSTLLYSCSGMDVPTAGEIYFNGVNMADLTAKQMQELRLEKMGFVFQKTSF